jgi:uncharacterized protein (TIGR02265 family)
VGEPNVPINQQDLDARLALASAAHTVKGAPFRSICAELQQSLPASATRDALLVTHKKAAWQELASFPVTDYLRLAFSAAALLEPQAGSFDAAMTLLGFKVSDAFLKSVVGRVAVMMASGKTPLDILAYAPATYAPVSNYGKRTFARLGPGEAVFRVREDYLPAAYHLGVIRCGMGINGHMPTVEVRSLSLLECDVVVRWSPASVERKAS